MHEAIAFFVVKTHLQFTQFTTSYMLLKPTILFIILFSNTKPLQPNPIIGKWKVVDYLAKTTNKTNILMPFLIEMGNLPAQFIFSDKEVSLLNKKDESIEHSSYYLKGNDIIINNDGEEIVYHYSLKKSHDTLLLSTNDFTSVLKKEK